MSFIDFLFSLFTEVKETPKSKEPIGIGEVGVNLIKDYEKLMLKAYLPTPNDVWTIGYGHTHTAKPGQVITAAKADVLLRNDLDWVEKTISDLVKVQLTQNQYDALSSFIFNIGRTQFQNCTALRRLNQGDYTGAADAMLWFNKQKGKTLNGLVKRRERERQLFLS